MVLNYGQEITCCISRSSPVIYHLSVQKEQYKKFEKLNLRLFCMIHMKEWYTVLDQYRRTHCVVSDLIMGNDYVFRVYAINQVGLSPEPCNTKDSAYIQKTGGLRVQRHN